jgi:hypothetical protein
MTEKDKVISLKTGQQMLDTLRMCYTEVYNKKRDEALNAGETQEAAKEYAEGSLMVKLIQSAINEAEKEIK